MPPVMQAGGHRRFLRDARAARLKHLTEQRQHVGAPNTRAADFGSAIRRFESSRPSQPVRSLRSDFRAWENRRHSGGLGFFPRTKRLTFCFIGLGSMPLAMSAARSPSSSCGCSRCDWPDRRRNVHSWQSAPKARIISGGRFHSESCRLNPVADERLGRVLCTGDAFFSQPNLQELTTNVIHLLLNITSLSIATSFLWVRQ